VKQIPKVRDLVRPILKDLLKVIETHLERLMGWRIQKAILKG
jgi:hypothetical protein